MQCSFLTFRAPLQPAAHAFYRFRTGPEGPGPSKSMDGGIKNLASWPDLIRKQCFLIKSEDKVLRFDLPTKRFEADPVGLKPLEFREF